MKKAKRNSLLIITSIFISLLMPVVYNHKKIANFEATDLETVHPSAEQSYTKQWIKNPHFDSSDNWNLTKGGLGDPDDVNSYISGGQANYEVLGEKRTFSIDDQYPWSGTWIDLKNNDFPTFPDSHGDNNYGLWVSHQWDEDAAQSPCVSWEQNYTMPVNMDDYVITSASVQADINGTVTSEPGGWGYGGIDVPGDTMDQHATYDYARYYILVSDLNKTKEYEVAFNQTIDLGTDASLGTDTMIGAMGSVSEESLIFYLTSVLETDGYNFTISLGIRIWCEDNFGSDSDYWDELWINSFNLTFSYEKRIDQFTSVSFDQKGDKPSDITDNPIIIDQAILEFEYKANDTWTSLSPNSEIRILINGIQYSETIKLSSATTSFQDAKSGGFDVGYLIDKNKNVSISIQVYLADEFKLDQIISFSIDNVYLNISYTESFPDILSDLGLFLNGDNKTADPVIELPLDENLNITIKYSEDQTGSHIINASVQLEGKVSGPLVESLALEQYSIIVNTSQLGIGVKILTITAQKDIYEPQQIQIFVEVTERDTKLTLFVNGFEKIGGSAVQVDLDETVNITVRYRDFITNKHLSNASVNLIGIGMLNETNNEYNISVKASTLGQGFTLLTIVAQLINYQSQSIEFYVEVIERETELKLFLNGIERYDGNTIQFEIDDIINITVWYRDNNTKDHISGASVILVGRGALNESNNQYNISINAEDLDQGVTVLSIFAQLINYQPQSIQFYIEVIERSTEIQLFLNGINKTDDPTYELTIGQSINITVKYTDKTTGMHIDTAILQLIGEGLTLNFTRDDILGQYYINLTTTVLGIGVKLFSVIAQANNYRIKTIDPRITVERINALIITESGFSQIEVEVGDDVTLRIVLNNTIFGGTVKNALVTYTWAYGPGNLTDPDNDGIYEAVLRNVQAGVYTITINAFAGDNFHFNTYKITLIVSRPVTTPGPNLSWLIYILVGAIVGLISFFGLYQKYFKYPPLVRKIRKLKKKIKKERKLKPVLVHERNEIIMNRFDDQKEMLNLEISQPDKLESMSLKKEGGD